jgi:RNA polymerase sigma factor FliA
MTATIASDRDAAILSLEPIVVRLASRVSFFASQNALVDKADLESVGWVAAIKAVNVYDPARGVPLGGYAQRVILGAMFNELRRCDPVSERDRSAVRKGTRVRHEPRHGLGREPSLAEIEAKVPGFKRAVVRCHQSPVSINAPRVKHLQDPSFDMTLEGSMAGGTDVATIVAERETVTELFAAVDRLDEKRRSVIESHYFGDRTLDDVAVDFHVTEQRASQIHRSALAKLREALAVAQWRVVSRPGSRTNARATSSARHKSAFSPPESRHAF